MPNVFCVVLNFTESMSLPLGKRPQALPSRGMGRLLFPLSNPLNHREWISGISSVLFSAGGMRFEKRQILLPYFYLQHLKAPAWLQKTMSSAGPPQPP